MSEFNYDKDKTMTKEIFETESDSSSPVVAKHTEKVDEQLPPASPQREHGPLIDHDIPQADAVPQRPDLWWSRFRETMQGPFCEFFGTFIILMFGDGVVAQVVLSGGKNGNYQSISWG